ncbi:uncharacterized protein EV422DRAFT_163824 [Fimicolochytrium jonesii]|uniref:uncharacterized protein n=1 Tax=Fimicolochytrium jonesii TaxID=1396493 RepID=UPI0022FE7638|nr:uncharacterized protein EV422DRAFT_163824 [Fimicolochytrium jonesii]KAI8818760.1 hypothetical protein EV422DRAFT_163824 [Fimicolochytrium jonesii]
MSSTGRLSQLRSALASSGISPTGQMQRKDIEKVTFPEIEQPEVLMAGIDTRGGEDAWKNLLDAERERVTKLLIDKADSDLRLSRLEEELQHQAIQNAEAKAKRDEEARETLRNVPISNAPYHPLNAVQRDKSSVSPIKRKPAHPSGSRPNPASDAKGKKPAGPARSFSAAAVGADRIRQLLRFVGRKKDGSGTSPNLDPTSRKSSYATAYDGPPGGRIFSSASRLAEPPMRGHGPLPQPPVQTRQAPAVSENVHFEATLQVPKPASLGPSQASLAPSQRSVVEHASEDEHISRQLLAELKLEDYDVIQSPERDMTEMLPIATPDADLPTRMDDIYTQIRALMLSQDALRTQKANDMREALTTILESYNLRIGGVEDNVGHWTKAKLEDARNRLTDALERVEREEKRKLDEERLARGTDKLREQMYQREKSRREQREQEADRRRAEQRAFEKHFRQMVEEEERQAEKVRKDSYFVPRDASYTAGRLSKDDDPDARGPKDASRRKKGEKNQARDAESTSKSKDKGKGRADAHRSPPPAGRITEWVEEQRRMSQSSASGSGEASGAHAGHPDEGVAGLAGPSTSYHKAQIRARVEGVRDRGDTSNYERIASAAAAAAAAGVSVAFRMGDETDDGYAKGGTKSQQPAQPGRGISRRDPVGNVSFDLQPAHAEQSAVPPQHSIRRKPSTSFPMPHHPIQHPHPIEAAYADLQDPYEYHAYEDGHGPATAAEPFPRYSGHGRESDRRRKGTNETQRMYKCLAYPD